MEILILPIIIVNIISFAYFAICNLIYKRDLEILNEFLDWRTFDDKAVLIACFGSIGALIAIFTCDLESFTKESHVVFRIVTPIAAVIQILVISYLILYEFGIVK